MNVFVKCLCYEIKCSFECFTANIFPISVIEFLSENKTKQKNKQNKTKQKKNKTKKKNKKIK